MKAVIYKNPVKVQYRNGESQYMYVAKMGGSIVSERKELLTKEQATKIWGKGNFMFKNNDFEIHFVK